MAKKPTTKKVVKQKEKRHPAITAKIARKLRWAAQKFLEEPRRADMERFMTHLSKGEIYINGGIAEPLPRPKRLMPPCGTVGCIAGWIVDRSPKLRKTADSNDRYAEGASLALTGSSSVIDAPGGRHPSLWSLFYPESWPQPFLSRLRKATPGTKKYAQVIAARIEHFIRENE